MKISTIANSANATTPNADAEYETAINGYLAQMENMQTEMEERQNRIERMRLETDSMLDSVLSSLKAVAR